MDAIIAIATISALAAQKATSAENSTWRLLQLQVVKVSKPGSRSKHQTVSLTSAGQLRFGRHCKTQVSPRAESEKCQAETGDPGVLFVFCLMDDYPSVLPLAARISIFLLRFAIQGVVGVLFVYPKTLLRPAYIDPIAVTAIPATGPTVCIRS